MISRRSLIQSVFVFAIFALLAGCASLPDNSSTPKTYAPTEVRDSALVEYFREPLSAQPNKSGVVVLGDGYDAFAARAILSLKAGQTIDAQYYLLNDDEVGKSFLGLLAQAADRGVRVRLLLDDILLSSSRNNQLNAFDAHPNMEIRIINPFQRKLPRSLQLITGFNTLSRRMHNKSFIADNQVAVMGGRNIGDEYFEKDPEVAFGDLDVLVVGPVVSAISKSFDEYWNSGLSHSIGSLLGGSSNNTVSENYRNQIYEYMRENQDSNYARAITESNFSRAFTHKSLEIFWGDVRLIVDSVEKLTADRSRVDLHLSGEMSRLFETAEDEIIIFSPYLIPGKQGTAGLTQLVSNGVKVRLLTNSAGSNNHAVVHAHYSKYRRQMLAGGIELYEARRSKETVEAANTETEKPQVLHAKTFVFDRNAVFVGSLNMDPRSWVENTEIGLLIESEEIASGVAQWFDQNVHDVAYRLRLDPGSRALRWESPHGINTTVEPETTPWSRFKYKSMSLLPLESLL